MQRILLPFGALAATLVTLFPATAQAQKVPVGAEFQVNSESYGYQGVWRGADVAAGANGGFVIVWDGYGDDSGGRRFDSSGTALGPDFEFGLPANPDHYGDDPAVSSDGSGNFVVVWEDAYGYYYVAAQRYDSTGSTVGAAFEVATSPAGSPGNPKVAMDPAGNFMIVWGHFQASDYGIGGRLYDSAGTAVAAPFRVDDPASYDSDGSNGIEEDRDGIEIAAGPSGDFMVVWETFDFLSSDNKRILGRMFDAAGAPTTGEFRIDSGGYFYSARGFPDVASDGAGNFIVVWSEDYVDVHARRYDSSGSPIGAIFQVDTPGGDYATPVKVAADTDGDFVVVWGNGYFTSVQQFDATATPVGPEFVLSQNFGQYGYRDTAYSADVAFTTGGDFVVAWRTYYAGYYSRDFGEIRAQRFGDPPGPCTPFPKTTCRQQTKSRGALRFREPSNPARKNLAWRWPKGEATDITDFGDPFTETDYALCVYDASGNAQPVISALAPAGGTCGEVVCWLALTGSETIQYFDRFADPEGVRRIRLRAGDDGRARVAFQGKGELLTLPQEALTPPVTAQLQATNGGECFTASYDARIRKNEPGKFRARPGSPSAAFLDGRGALFD